tara:strand:- start:2724 stop:3569 length:846 start_codon:yes stop_codon:yes gene_type:complete
MDLKEQIRVALGLNKIKLEWQAKSEDGTIFVSTTDELAVGSDIAVLTEDGTTIPVPAGTYKTAEGLTFVVEEEGIVSEVLESETEEVEEEVVEAAEEGEADVEDWSGLEKRIQNLEDAVASLKGDKGGDAESEDMTEEEDTKEVVEEVTDKVQGAVEEIAAAIDEATPEEVTPELAAKAAEIAVGILQDKVEDVVEDSTATTLSKKRTAFRKTKAKRTPRTSDSKLTKLKAENNRLKDKLANTPASGALDTNKFSSQKSSATKQDLKRMSKKERFMYDLHN